MLYRLLRWVAGVALDWFYGGVTIVGAARVPNDAPLLVLANHPNQLVDVLLVARALGRRVRFTGKAVLMENPAVALLGRAIGFVPLRRVQDELKAQRGGPPAGTMPPAGAGGDTTLPPAAPLDRDRNAAAFDAIIDELARGGAVLIFPEGISHDRPELAPIKTGAARIALQARDERGVRGLHLVALGLTFERKWAPRTRVLAQAGEPLAMDAWRPPGGAASSVAALTAEVERRLRAVTLNFPTREAAETVLPVSVLLAALLEDEVRPLADPRPPLPAVFDLARRAEAVRQAVERAAEGRSGAADGGEEGGAAREAGAAGAAGGDAATESPVERARVERFAARLAHLRDALAAHRIAPSEVGVDTDTGAGAWFVAREAALVALGGPVALWGRVNHWLPLALARAVARRTGRNPEDPAMHTIVAGVALVPLFYALQAALVWRLAGGWWALAYLVSLPAAAGWSLRYADRLAHARRRVHAYLLFRRNPALCDELRAEVAWVRREAAEIEAMTVATEAAAAGAARSVTPEPGSHTQQEAMASGRSSR